MKVWCGKALINGEGFWCNMNADQLILSSPTDYVLLCGYQGLITQLAYRRPTCPECLEKMEVLRER